MSADLDSQDKLKNLVGSPDRFAKTAGSCNLILTHDLIVYPQVTGDPTNAKKRTPKATKAYTSGSGGSRSGCIPRLYTDGYSREGLHWGITTADANKKKKKKKKRCTIYA